MTIARWVSMGFEATFNTAVAGKYFIDPTRVSLDSPASPFIFYAGASGRGERAIVPAGYMPTGDVEAVMEQFRMGAMLRGLVPGVNYQQNGLTKAGQATTVDTAGMAVGDTNVPVAASAGFTAGDIIQIGADLGPSEVFEVAQVNTGPDSLDLDDAAHFAYSVGVVIDEITGVDYVHTFDIGGGADLIDPMTVRVAKDLDEQIFSGVGVNSIRLSAGHNSLLTLVANLIAAKDAVGAVPSVPASGIISPPYASPHLTVAALDGLSSGSTDILANIRSAEFQMGNNISGEDGLRMGSRFPVEHRGLGITMDTTLTMVFRTRTEYDDFFGGVAGPVENDVVGRDIHLTYTQSALEALDIWAYNAYPTQPATPISGRDQLIQTVNWHSIQPTSTDLMGRIQLKTAQEHRYF